MKWLVGCEHSGRVRDALRARGQDAWSCDRKPDLFGNDRYHIQGDVLEAITAGWDRAVFFPPCTHLAAAGGNLWKVKQASGQMAEAEAFFLALYNAPIAAVAVENPVGWMNTHWRPADQIIDPWMFGDPYQKRTCLWLRGLPRLEPEVAVKPNDVRLVVRAGSAYRHGRTDASAPYGERFGKAMRATAAAITFPGIARAMAEQWACDRVLRAHRHPGNPVKKSETFDNSRSACCK